MTLLRRILLCLGLLGVVLLLSATFLSESMVVQVLFAASSLCFLYNGKTLTLALVQERISNVFFSLFLFASSFFPVILMGACLFACAESCRLQDLQIDDQCFGTAVAVMSFTFVGVLCSLGLALVHFGINLIQIGSEFVDKAFQDFSTGLELV